MSDGQSRVAITREGAAVVECGLSMRQAHELRTGCTIDDPCARCLRDMQSVSAT